MARVQERKAAKDYPAAGIAKGETYFYVKIKTGPRSSRVIRSKTRPSRSQLTQSDFLGQLYDIQDNGFQGIEDAQGLRDVAEQLRTLGQEQQEKLDNMPDGLQQGDTGQMIQERIDGCESWADEMDQAADQLESDLADFDGAVEECRAYLAARPADAEGEPGDDDDAPALPDGLDWDDLADQDLVDSRRAEIVQDKVDEAEQADPGMG